MTTLRASSWIESWDRQQERYVADREERFAVIGDVLAHRLGTADAPVLLDLGCGPGSLAARLADRFPGARVIGVDSDPLLLALGAERYPGIEFVDADLAVDGWANRLPSTVDAAVSTTALHWLPQARLAGMYATLSRLLRPGGVFVNGDHLALGSPGLHEMAVYLREQRAVRAGVADNQEWQDWWAEVEREESLASLLAQRKARTQTVASGDRSDEHRVNHGSNALTATEHATMLRAADFTEVGTVWQSGDDQILVAIH